MSAAPLAANARILCIKLADIGDVLLCTPALRALRRRYPDATIDLLTPPSSAKVLGEWPLLDEVIVFDKFPFDSLAGLADLRGVARAGGFMLSLARRRYDAVVVFHHFSLGFGALKFAALVLATAAGVRVGLDNGRGWFLNRPIKDRGFGAMHEAEYWLQLIAQLDADPVADAGPELPIGPADRAAAAALLDSLGLATSRRIVAIHPGAGWYSTARRWPAASFAQLIGELITRRDVSVLLLGGPDERDLAEGVRDLVAEEQRGRVFNVAGQTSIAGSAALLERCRLFIGNDSGPMHIATAAATPVVAVFGLSNWLAFGPFVPHDSARATVVRRDLPCQPCLYRGMDLGLRDGCATRECLTALPPERVLRAAERMLDRAGLLAASIAGR